MSEEALQADDLIAPYEGDSDAVFPKIDWRWQDVALGVAPIAVTVGALKVLPPESVPFVVPLNIALLGWMWIYPTAIARFRGAQFRWPSARVVLKEALIAVPTLVAIWLGLGIAMGITLWLFPQLSRNTNPFIEAAASAPTSVLLWVMLIGACVIAPLCEELFFRGMLFQFLKQYVDVRSAILLQGLLFGFGHTFGTLHAVMASFLGISFAIVYEWRKTIVAPVCLHVLQNTCALIATLTMAQMVANGPQLGVQGVAHEQGYEITSVRPDGSAANAGLKVGDVIVGVGDSRISDVESLRAAVRKHQVGDRVTVEYFRRNDQDLIKVEVQLKQWGSTSQGLTSQSPDDIGKKK